MHILVLIAVMIVVGTGIAYQSSKTEVTVSTTLGDSTTQAPSPSVAPTTTITPSQNPTSTPAAPTSTKSPTPKPTSVPSSASTLVYPGSTVMSSSRFESTDNPEKITDWYKDQIRSQGYNTKSFVTTSTNGEILNKLAAAKSGSSITVEITKSSSSSKTTISLVLDK